MTERRYDIDWLRVLAMLAVFVFHCTRFFDTEGWHLKNAEQSFVLFILVRGLMWPWLMEIFFLLSGVGAWYVLRTRSAGAFVGDRAKRLLLPLYTVGLFILLPPQFYFQRVIMDSSVGGGLRQWLPAYFGDFGLPRLSPWPMTLLPLPFDGHLWFLKFLFLISLAALPLLIFLKSARGLRWIDSLAGWCGRRGGIFVFVIPLALAYCNEAVLPFYLFHQTIILLVGYFVIRWNMGILPKFLIVTVLSFAAIMALYEFGVRRIRVMRFLFGMRPIGRS